MIKKPLVWLHGVPLVIYVLIAFFAYTRIVGWQAVTHKNNKEQLKTVAAAFHVVNEENARLNARLRTVSGQALALMREANQERAKQQIVLAQHPVSEAPKVCGPYVQTLTSCQREALRLRAANLLLQQGVDTAIITTTRIETVTNEGKRATEKVKGGCGFPWIRPEAGPGAMLGTDLKFHVGISVIAKLC